MNFSLRVGRNMLSLALAGTLTSCAEPPPPLSKSTIADMLLTRMTQQCDRQTLFIRRGKFGTGQAQRAEDWFNQMVRDPNVSSETEFDDDAGHHGELHYRDDQYTLRVNWSRLGRPSLPDTDRLSITSCIYVPKSVSIIDSQFEPSENTGRVTFQVKFRLSLVGKKMSDAGLLRTYGPVAAPSDYEYVALLSRGAKHAAWRIRALGVN